MAEIRPFCGYRFALQAPDDLKKFVAPPYDMLSAEMIDSLYATDNHNVVRVTQCKAMPEDTANIDRHRRAAQTLSMWIKDNVLIRDTEPSLYVYKQKFTYDEAGAAKTVERTGVVALVKLVDFSEKVVLPHEATLSGPKQDRLDLLAQPREPVAPALHQTGTLEDREMLAHGVDLLDWRTRSQ